jgi:thioredoxin-dependent adenylylsulfate APS reductase
MTREREAVGLDELEVGDLSVLFEDREAETLIEWAVEQFGSKLAIVTSFQAEGMVILDMATKIDPRVRVITIDPGRLPEESYQFMDRVRHRYGTNIEVHFPAAEEVQAMVARHGVNLFYQDLTSRLLCCQVRKVRPLQRALRGLSAWVTGLRREQSVSRAHIHKIELDHHHGAMVKLNPLADWTEQEVWDYLEAHDVPQHPLYQKGYTTIGCAPCTRPLRPGEHPRAGRWWWERNAPKECGIHCSFESGGLEHQIGVLLKQTGSRME